MRPVLLPLLFLLVCAVAFAAACSDDEPGDEVTPSAAPRQAPQGQLVEARVVGVVDGATIEVDIGGQLFRVRYLGVEIAQPAQSDAPSLSQEALAFNRFLVEGRTVEIERGSTEADSAGNLLRYVYVDGEMVNKALLTNGYATVSNFPGDFEYKMEFLAAEEKAKASARGIWAPRSREEQVGATATPVQQFGGGTLPAPPRGVGGRVCDFSGTSDPVIKGNVDSLTGERAYHVPGGLFYTTTVVDEDQGDRWFCTEDEAVAAGWHRSKR
ncbi:MAG: thermonuclease family protein [Chloroflexi bacterium]|nr:thermonuclease family protein [Chloroflexota bacterium]